MPPIPRKMAGREASTDLQNQAWHGNPRYRQRGSDLDRELGKAPLLCPLATDRTWVPWEWRTSCRVGPGSFLEHLLLGLCGRGLTEDLLVRDLSQFFFFLIVFEKLMLTLSSGSHSSPQQYLIY